MKIRTGFVANSSSSSFLIALDTPLEKDDPGKFRKQFSLGNYTYDDYGSLFEAKEIMEAVTKGLILIGTPEDPPELEDVVDIVARGFIEIEDLQYWLSEETPEKPTYPNFSINDIYETTEKIYEVYCELRRHWARFVAGRILCKTNGQYLYTGEFWDNDNLLSFIERGDAFVLVDGVRINLH